MIKGKSVEMEVTFEVNELEKMKRPELQQLCKSFGIKANMKNSLLIEALKEQAAQFSSKRKRSLSAKTSPLVNASTATTEETDDQEMTQDDDDNNETFKKQLLDQLEKKVEEKMPVDCKIPRFVQFAKNLKSTKDDDHNKTPGNKWSKIHKVQFEKMDSIDVYLEKKRKRREFFNQSAKRAKSVGANRKSVDKQAEVPVFKSTALDKSASFVFGSPSAKLFFQEAKKEARVSTAKSTITKGKKLKSPKIIKPLVPGDSTKSGETRNRFRRTIAMASAVENKPKTPANPARKSMVMTPFRCSPVNVTAAPMPTPKKTFDLQASLAKSLPYKPHTGKLKPLSSYREEYRPTLSESKLKGHKVDVKKTKVTTREERRLKENFGRERRRATALNRQRGIVC